MLPNFLCIGAQKAGTTSVSVLLEAHPDVYMAQPRETRFFVDDALFEMGVAHYELRCFDGWSGQKAIGEKTPEYLLFDETPARVRAMLGEAVKLIVRLRSQAARAHSHYRHNLTLGVETLGFREALELEPGRIAGDRVRQGLFGYRHRGQYARRLAPWFAAFRRSNFLILVFEELTSPARSSAEAKRVFDFLGLTSEPSPQLPRLGRPKPALWSVDQTEVAFSVDGQIRRARSPSSALRQFASKAGRLHDAPPSEDELRAPNKRFWADDIRALQGSIGLDVSAWLGS